MICIRHKWVARAFTPSILHIHHFDSMLLTKRIRTAPKHTINL